jgi:hypothetical protein
MVVVMMANPEEAISWQSPRTGRVLAARGMTTNALTTLPEL